MFWHKIWSEESSLNESYMKLNGHKKIWGMTFPIVSSKDGFAFTQVEMLHEES
jgi:hypothetical protein